ncbi:MAG: hypothetical protein ACPGF7_14500 [Pontibacterium sp.]
MHHSLKTWTPEQIAKMNEESFLTDLIDTLKYSPEFSDNEQAIELMKAKLDAIETRIKYRLEAK